MAKQHSKIAALLLFLLHAISAQTMKDGNETIAATYETVSPAAAGISSDTLLPSETLQLTDAILANLTSLELSNVSLFGFTDNSTSAASRRPFASGFCKTYPGDSLWPSDIVWDVFDLLLGGALIETKPLASPCYDDFGNYDGSQCAWLSVNWANDSYFQTDDPTSINAVLYQNSTCLPPEVWPYDQNCTLGSYPPYSVNVSNVAQIQLAINLARTLDLRLVVKNTGHDFGAKSTGAGGLNIWTHNLKEIKFLGDSYTAGGYTGPALKIGAGAQAYEIYAACHRYNVTCVGGEGKTVGVAGGYIQGGGHSPMSSMYGMAADQALSFEVVTADGRFVTADESQNTDLFWALRGGGGGTFGVLTSVTVKAYARMPVSFITFTIGSGGNVTTDAFWSAIQAYWDGFVTWTEADTYSYFWIDPISPDSYIFYMEAWWAPNKTAAELEALTAPLFANWTALGISLKPVFQEFDNYYDAWEAAFPLELWSINTLRQASRLFPRANWANATIKTETFASLRWALEQGLYVSGFHLAPGQHVYPDNAVNPAWREALGHIIMASVWDETLWESSEGIAKIKEISDNVTYVWNARWRDITPGSGAYCSESDYIEPDFQHSFWGDHYARLYEIKQKYDPYGLFFAQNAVGSEDWAVDSYILGDLPSQAGKLCRL
ncbi:putative FAD-linked oxidoreductase YvdP [Cytospora mali]|uniref:FAD-linked oxidoreductase YvdP n=1 Tax=Cytospora mali TaxID=578113 RepID=A0A194VUQ4_CYTMA|nr:putative FAD-linked oxidoreductase YvdP [Valsa mali]